VYHIPVENIIMGLWLSQSLFYFGLFLCSLFLDRDCVLFSIPSDTGAIFKRRRPSCPPEAAAQHPQENTSEYKKTTHRIMSAVRQMPFRNYILGTGLSARPRSGRASRTRPESDGYLAPQHTTVLPRECGRQ